MLLQWRRLLPVGAEGTQGLGTCPWVMACLLLANRPFPSASDGRVAWGPGWALTPHYNGHLHPFIPGNSKVTEQPGGSLSPRVRTWGLWSQPAGRWGRSHRDTLVTRHLWPQHRAGALLGRVLLGCRGRQAGRTKRPLQCPGRVHGLGDSG